MATAKKLGLSVLAVVAVLLVGGLAWAVTGSASGNKTRERNGNMTAMRGGGPGGMHGIMNATALGLAETATAEEIKTAMESKMTQQRAALDAAISAGDYDAWKTAIENTPQGQQLTSVITEANYAKYAEMESYRMKAKAIATELGLEGKGMGKGLGRGMGGPGSGGKPPEQTASEETSE